MTTDIIGGKVGEPKWLSIITRKQEKTTESFLSFLEIINA